MDGKPTLRSGRRSSATSIGFGSGYDDDIHLNYDTDEDEVHKGTNELNEDRDTMLTLIKCYLGAGFLGLPFAFKNAGWLGGILCLLIATMLSAYTASILGVAKEQVLKDEDFLTSSRKRPKIDLKDDDEGDNLLDLDDPRATVDRQPAFRVTVSYADLAHFAFGYGGEALTVS